MKNARNTKRVLCLVAFLGASFCVSRMTAGAADWPAYRMDSARTATTGEKLTFPMSPAWIYRPAHKPQPAWPDAFLIRGRGKNFDQAPQPVMVGDVVYFGSTTDDTLWALDAVTGLTKWGFTTGGPIRFAPAIADGRAYVVSDDGWAYCLDAAGGQLIWKFFGGLSDRRLPGNGRMISRWPIRSGVTVRDGVVHFAAGMWSSEGVYVYALDAKTGRQVWCNDTNLDYLPMPHASTALTGNMPQGYLALGGNRVVYNNGVGGNWAYDARTGRLTGRSGGTETLKKAKGGNYEDYEPSKFLNWSLLILDGKTGETVHHGEPEGKAESLGLVPLHAALAGDTLIRCDGGKVVAVDKAGKGKQVWQHVVEGTACGIAVAGGRLLVSTTSGAIYCFKPGAAGQPAGVGPGASTFTKTAPHSGAAAVLAELAKQKVNRGYALVLGEQDAKLAEALAAQTELQVICLLTNEAKVNAERKRLRETTDLYGVRVTVDYWQDTTRLPFAQYLTNLIVVTARPAGLPEAELARVQRPCGGILMQGDKVSVRGKLPGALDWDSEVTSDQRLRGTLELLWFGEPGPTHSAKITPSIAAGGRLFVFGPSGDVLTAVDAYNGTILWTRKMDDNPKGMVADDRYLYAGKLVLDAQSGQEVKAPAGKRPPAVVPRRSESQEEKYLGMRQHPLTDGLSSKAHDRLHGCGHWTSSASMEFFRSSTLSYYDYEDDSGIRNFGGVRPGCAGGGLTPALGLLLYGESTGVPSGGGMGASCSCAYPFKTSLALAPVERRRNEDWAVFQDIPWPRSGSLNHVAINCGAPGDRRDGEGKLWLTSPRPKGPSGWAIYKKVDFTLPYKPEFYGQQRHFRSNSDRLAIEGTDRPWLYASGYVGIKRLTWDLDYYNRYHQCLSLPAAKAPTIDGQLDDACWADAAELLHPYAPPEHKKSLDPDYADPIEAAYARHDDKNLYFAYRKRLLVDRRGKSESIKAATKGTDAPVWQDDSFELFLSDGSGNTVIHLGVAASGATYDSLLRFPPLPEDRQAAKASLKDAANEDASWNGDWASKVRGEKDRFAAEVSIPWKTLTDLGIDKNDLRLNLSHLRSPYGRKPFTRQAQQDSLRLNLSQTKPTVKPYTVRLHFAEPTCQRPGQRVFDVVVGGKVVLKDLDVFAESGGRNKALVREIRGVPAVQNLVLEFVPSSGNPTDADAPILCGLEIIAEQPGPAPDPVYAKLERQGRHSAFVRYSDIEKTADQKKTEAGKAKN